jgi:hypothetical protein
MMQVPPLFSKYVHRKRLSTRPKASPSFTGSQKWISEQGSVSGIK